MDNLVSIDYGIQQEIYMSGYHKWSQCWFADWNPVPAEILSTMFIGFDIPVIRSIFPWFIPPDNCVDTLLLSRLYHPNMMSIDQKHRWQNMPLQLYGRHSLESYGYRLGEYKGNFSKTTDWKEWSQEMEDYCVQDVQVTKKLCEHFHPYLIGSR